MAAPFPHRPVSSDGAPSGEPEAFRTVGSGAVWLLRPEEGSAPIPVTIRQGSPRRRRLCIRVRPGGAVELCRILGREETLRRAALGMDKLNKIL